MDDWGIDMAILSTAVPAASGYDFCKLCNDGYSAVIKKYPDRFRGVIHAYPFDADERNRNEIKSGGEEFGEGENMRLPNLLQRLFAEFFPDFQT